MTKWMAVLLLSGAWAHAENPRLVVMKFTGSGVDAAQLDAVTQRATSALAARGVYEVVASTELESLLGLERQRQLLGCGESTCLAELSGALGARFVMNGAVVKLGQAWQLTLTTLDSQRAQPVGRALRLASTLPELLASMPAAVAEATGLPPPPEPSRLGPALLLGVGGALLVAGGVVGVQALTQEAALQGELSNQVSLDARADYLRRAEQPALMKSIALGTLIGGGVAVLVGALWWPRTGPTEVALVPTGTGFALVGRWP